MRRVEIWTKAGGFGYAGKPSPVVIVQGGAIAARDHDLLCLNRSLLVFLGLAR